ncbi:hypothetical protein L218DRAFT_955846, partial [Marasmius fiardii PR-910]
MIMIMIMLIYDLAWNHKFELFTASGCLNGHCVVYLGYTPTTAERQSVSHPSPIGSIS